MASSSSPKEGRHRASWSVLEASTFAKFEVTFYDDFKNPVLIEPIGGAHTGLQNLRPKLKIKDGVRSNFSFSRLQVLNLAECRYSWR